MGSLNCQEFIERAEYRKPDWLVQMEMIKERLAAIVQNAKITKEIQTNRIKEGTSTEFTAGFAGNPQPEVAWFYNGNKLEESDRVKNHDEHDHLDPAHGRLHHGDGRRLRVQDRQQARQRQDQSQPDHKPSVRLEKSSGKNTATSISK